jgi:hypothetical protein
LVLVIGFGHHVIFARLDFGVGSVCQLPFHFFSFSVAAFLNSVFLPIKKESEVDGPYDMTINLFLEDITSEM